MESGGSKSLVFFGQPAYIFYVRFNDFRTVKIPVKRVFDPGHGYLRRQFLPAYSLRESQLAGFSGQSVFTGEVLVEAALGHTGGLHNVRDTDRLDSMRPKKATGDLHDPYAISAGLAPARSCPGSLFVLIREPLSLHLK